MIVVLIVYPALDTRAVSLTHNIDNEHYGSLHTICQAHFTCDLIWVFQSLLWSHYCKENWQLWDSQLARRGVKTCLQVGAKAQSLLSFFFRCFPLPSLWHVHCPAQTYTRRPDSKMNRLFPVQQWSSWDIFFYLYLKIPSIGLFQGKTQSVISVTCYSLLRNRGLFHCKYIHIIISKRNYYI